MPMRWRIMGIKVAINATGTLWLLGIHLLGIDAVFAQTTQINADDTFDAISYGNNIHFGWVKLPNGTTKIILSRASKQNGPWVAVLIDEYPNELTSTGRMLYTEKELVPPDTANDYFYKLEAFSAMGLLLKNYPPVFVPRFVR
jgi:hypothetical protein